MSVLEKERLSHFGSRLPSAFYARPSGSNSQADTPSSAPDFEEWLFTDARTELGKFPDWPYVRDYARALASGRDLIVLKRRQILVSWITAAYVHFMASRNPYWHAAIVSAGKTTSAKQGRRIVTVARHDGYNVQGVDLIKYPSGSEVTILPSTEHAGVGESLKFFHADEFAFHPYGRENMDTIRPGVSNSGGQTVITSTANPQMGEGGTFYEYWQDSPDEQRLFYGKYFKGQHIRPDQGDDFYATESEKPGQTAAIMSAYYPENPAAAFVAHAGLVYGEDHDGVLIFHPQQNIALPEWTWQQSKWRLASVDPGGTGTGSDPTGITIWGVSRDERCYQYAEKLWRGNPGTTAMADWLSEWENKAPFDFVLVDPTAPTTIVDLQKWFGLRAMGANNDRTTGMAEHAALLKSRRFKIHPDCVETKHQYQTYWKQPRKDRSGQQSNMVTVTPSDHHAELPDNNRYITLRLKDGLPMGSTKPTPMKFHRTQSTRFGR